MKPVRKVADVLFIICFLTMLLVPFLMLDTAEEINSELENRAMTKWPGLRFDKLHTEWYGHYVEDRVGFREEAIRINADLSYRLFGDFSEDLHMFGQEGYIFPADEGYVKNYQRTNINEPLMENLVTYAARTDAYAKKNGCLFVVMICPNKSSVYGEYMPESIYVDETKESTLDLAKRRLTEEGVTCIIPHEEFRAQKEQEQIYNVKYDCAHWNDLGALCGLSMMDRVIAENYPDIPVMKRSDFLLTWEEVENLEFYTTEEPIYDSLPKLQLIEEPSVTTDSPQRVDLPMQPGNAVAYYYNDDALSDRKILVLHDSFLDYKENWYTYRYKEVYYGSRVNYTHMKAYIDLIQPDVIIFEVAERAFADDLHAYTELGNVTYQ